MHHNIFKSKTDMLVTSVLIAITIAIHLPIDLRMLSSYDYYVHLGLAQSMLRYHLVLTPHFLYQLVTIIIYMLLPLKQIATAGLITVLLCYAFTAIIVFYLLRSVETLSRPIAAIITVSLMLVAPFPLLAIADDHLYFGYIGINVFHNPTIVVLKPFALLLFYFSVRVFQHQKNDDTRFVIINSVLIILSALAKPSYIICFLPALALFSLVKLARKEKPRWMLLSWGFVVPAIIVLAIQYYLTYSSTQMEGVYQGQSAIIFAPFAFMSSRSSFLFLKFLFSTLFPFAVLLCYFRSAIKDQRLVFAWLTFLFGAFYTYFLAESGPRMLQGNFAWSGQISLFILFVASALFYMRELLSGNNNAGNLLSRKKVLFCAAMYGLHVLSGVLFYLAEYNQSELYW
jgi:hypothetical protein